MVSWQERIAGGLYGLLVGDALGVSYEFYEAWELPAYEEIEMVPPPGFRKTYPKVDAGTWSDDGAQALCLMDSLLKHGKFSLKAYSDALLAWYEKVSGRSMERYSMLGFRQRMRLEHIKKESLQRIAD